MVVDNFLINWSSIKQLPCHRLSTLVICSATSRGNQTGTLKAIMGLICGCKYWKVVIIKLVGTVDGHTLDFKPPPKSVNDVLIWAEDFSHLTLEKILSGVAAGRMVVSFEEGHSPSLQGGYMR